MANIITIFTQRLGSTATTEALNPSIWIDQAVLEQHALALLTRLDRLPALFGGCHRVLEGLELSAGGLDSRTNALENLHAIVGNDATRRRRTVLLGTLLRDELFTGVYALRNGWVTV